MTNHLHTLLLFSGLPGSGKTALARYVAAHLHIPLFSKDRVQRVLSDQVANINALDGYHILLDQADEQLGLGLSAILDAVFPLSGFRQEARQIAQAHGARFLPVYCYCSDEALWRSRMQNRYQYVPGWPPADWLEVERLAPMFEDWEDPDVIQLDSLHPVEDNGQKLLAIITRKEWG